MSPGKNASANAINRGTTGGSETPTYRVRSRVARTIADLSGADTIGRIHLAEALSYRRQAPRS